MTETNAEPSVGTDPNPELRHAFEKYIRVEKRVDARPYRPGESLRHIKVRTDDNPETDRGYIGRDPANHAEQWYIPKAFFESQFRPKADVMAEKEAG